jgi:hypothetical protein
MTLKYPNCKGKSVSQVMIDVKLLTTRLRGDISSLSLSPLSLSLSPYLSIPLPIYLSISPYLSHCLTVYAFILSSFLSLSISLYFFLWPISLPHCLTAYALILSPLSFSISLSLSFCGLSLSLSFSFSLSLCLSVVSLSPFIS